MKTSVRRIACSLTLLFALVLGALAQPVVYFDNSAGDRVLGGGFNGTSQMQGWDFQVVSNLTVTHLGLFDGHETGGYLEPHSVGLWNLAGQLLASADFPVGEAAPLLGSFRYVAITPVTLQAGQTFVVGVFLPGPVSDYTFLFLPEQASFYNLSIDARIMFGNYRANLSDGLAFPTTVFPGYYGGFGPNLIITNAPPTPAPTPLALKARVRDDLAALRSTPMRQSDRALLATAIFYLNKSLNPGSWTDGSHLRAGGRGHLVFLEEMAAVQRLLQLRNGNHPPISPARWQEFIGRLVGVDRSLAAAAIAEASARGGNAAAIQRAQAFLSRGDVIATGQPASAIDRYRLAWATATGS